MRTITVSSKNQVTIPVSILREVGIHPGDRMAVAAIDGEIVLIREPEDWAQYFQVGTRGAHDASEEGADHPAPPERRTGNGPVGQGDTREWRKQFEDLYATDSEVRAVADTLMDCPYHVATFPDLEWLVQNGHPTHLARTLDTLTANRWVRRIPAHDEEPECYRLDGEIAAWLEAA
ncbi:MAG: AbrB/MazE/SpoVT family DNA-binding domain-containing protein [Chloroflexota bacterium]|nr:AbrB/MazE/SpoVT family DNA-binding domain-containing protein [Chloroflexota bacterium]MDE2885898.1 AbrB/MazE/SpoVT family DNA-binding domain-containing protein [Chloroflexota bacterium]